MQSTKILQHFYKGNDTKISSKRKTNVKITMAKSNTEEKALGAKDIIETK